MNKGKDVQELTKQVSVQTDTAALYQRANIPPAGDAGWISAPDPDVIGFGIDGKGEHLANSIVLEAKAFRSADYTYFETVVTKPAGVTVEEFKIVFDQMDDGSRVTIFNKDHPEGIVVEGSYVKIGDSESSQDLKGQLADGANRIVVTQVDVCPPYNMLKSAKIEIKSNGGKKMIIASSAPIPLTSHGDVHVYTPDRLAYDFQATGEFLCSQSADKTIVVQSRQETWPQNPKVSVNTAAAVSVAGDKI